MTKAKSDKKPKLTAKKTTKATNKAKVAPITLDSPKAWIANSPSVYNFPHSPA